MIAIINVRNTENRNHLDEREYEVRINRRVIATFKHCRSDGLAVCLQQASEAVCKRDAAIVQAQAQAMRNVLLPSNARELEPTADVVLGIHSPSEPPMHTKVIKTRCVHDYCVVGDDGGTRCSHCGRIDPRENE